MRSSKHLLTLGLALGAAGLVSCSTPKPECTVAATTVFGAGLSGVQAYSMRYVLVSGTGPCAELKGEIVGMQPYHPASADDPQVRDLSKTSIAIRTQSHGEMAWMNEDFGLVSEGDQPNAIGDFTASDPDDSDFCQVPTLTEARVVFPGATIETDLEIPCMTDQECTDAGAAGAVCTLLDPMDPASGSCIASEVFEATTMAYRWSNVQVYVTAAATGTQLTADLEVELNGCTAQYKAIGMWPAVDCTVGADEMTGAPIGDNRMCHPEPDPTNPELPRPYGSGINPDFGPIVCNPDYGPVGIVNQYYGGGFHYAMCTPGTDTLPALEGFPSLEEQQP